MAAYRAHTAAAACDRVCDAGHCWDVTDVCCMWSVC